MCKEKIERDRRRGILNRPVRAMVAGIPNVGKSTFINSFAGKACTKTGNKPGVTKGKQWIRLNKGLELLDTPGILWPKFEDQSVGMKLAFIGSMNDEIIIMDELAIGPDCLSSGMVSIPSSGEVFACREGKLRSRCWKRRPKSANATKRAASRI